MAKVVKIPSVPTVSDPAMNSFLTAVKQAVEQYASSVPTPQPVTGLKATAIAGGAVVQFTRSNASNFRLYYGSSPNRASAQIVDLGDNNNYTDNVGQGGITRYYWVQPMNQNAPQQGAITGAVSATTLALGTAATVIPPIQQSYMMVRDSTINAYRPAIYGTDYVTPGKQANQ